jgi:hypothetical protein
MSSFQTSVESAPSEEKKNRGKKRERKTNIKHANY